MIVLDASAAVEAVLDLPLGLAVIERLSSAPTTHAPAHLDMEVLSALRRLSLRGLLSDRDADIAFTDYEQLPIRRWPSTQQLMRAFALRHSVGAGDALYVALSEVLEAPLITTDKRLARSHGHRAQIELIE